MIGRIRELYRVKQFLSQNVMGINRRNLELVIPHNSRKNLTNVNEKVLCKQLLEAGGVPTPRTIMVCYSSRDLREFGVKIVNHSAFVIKPARGFGGEGIILIRRFDGEVFHDNDGNRLTVSDLQRHVQSIFDGVYSLDNYADTALVEELVVTHPSLAALCGSGVPDIRIIVFRTSIIAGMLRLPTKKSGGKANLHQGGVGVGLDVRTGMTTRSTVKGEMITHHPDTGQLLSDVPVPGWRTILEVSPKIPSLMGLGYVGIDYVIDQNRGVLVLEVNGRPGLQIQVANMKGLRANFEELVNEE